VLGALSDQRMLELWNNWYETLASSAAALAIVIVIVVVAAGAYLTERWAARFVSELFRNYLVCLNSSCSRSIALVVRSDAILGVARLRPDQHAQGRRLANARHRAHRSAN
jgi:hypothetical protein